MANLQALQLHLSIDVSLLELEVDSLVVFPACCEIVCCAFLICCVCEMYHPFIFTVHTVIFHLRAPCEAHRTLFSTQTSPWGSLITLLLSTGLINGTLTYQPMRERGAKRGSTKRGSNRRIRNTAGTTRRWQMNRAAATDGNGREHAIFTRSCRCWVIDTHTS